MYQMSSEPNTLLANLLLEQVTDLIIGLANVKFGGT
jgi:hypothetical protein